MRIRISPGLLHDQGPGHEGMAALAGPHAPRQRAQRAVRAGMAVPAGRWSSREGYAEIRADDMDDALMGMVQAVSGMPYLSQPSSSLGRNLSRRRCFPPSCPAWTKRCGPRWRSAPRFEMGTEAVLFHHFEQRLSPEVVHRHLSMHRR
jgi:hypothetical protein